MTWWRATHTLLLCRARAHWCWPLLSRCPLIPSSGARRCGRCVTPAGETMQLPLQAACCSFQELQVLRFNVVDNRSSEWGTAPFHWCVLRSQAPGEAGKPAHVPTLLGAFCLMRPRRSRRRKVLHFCPATCVAWCCAACGAGHGAGAAALAASAGGAFLRCAVLQAAAQGALRTASASHEPWPSDMHGPGAQEVRFLFPVLPLFNMCAAAALARAYAARRATSTRDVSQAA
jgi:hypothetical protein